MKKIVILSLFLQSCGYLKEIELQNVCVVDKNLAYSHDKTQYRIYSKKEVFEISYSIVKMRFNSSDLYANIEKGKCYDFTVYGWRVPFFSMYRNILTAKETNETKAL